MKKIIQTTYTEQEFRQLIREELTAILIDNNKLENKTSEDENFLTASQAGDFLRLKRGSIYNLINQNKIPYQKKPGSNRVLLSKKDLWEWLKKEGK